MKSNTLAIVILAVAAAHARQPTDAEREDAARTIARIPCATSVLFKLGVAGYTFNEKTLDEALVSLKDIDCHWLCHKDKFLPYDADDAKIAAYKAKLERFGVGTVTTGPLYVKDEATVRKQFDFAKRFGLKVVVGVPYKVKEGCKDGWGPQRQESDEMLDVIEKLVKEYDIRYAIHNHGPDLPSLYPTAESVWSRIEKRDPRIGFCLDVGHQARAGKDPVATIHAYSKRIYDVHLKNVKIDPEINFAMQGPRGELEIPRILQALCDIGYDGGCHIEYERDFTDNALGLAESFGYYRGVMDMLKPRRTVEVVAVYYPHWHKYPKGTEWFGKKWDEGEWNFVKTAVPRYPGHLQPMKPLPGYLDGSDSCDVETEIALASNAGIDVFLYDYYYYGGKVTQEEAIEKGFLKARNRDKMKFALMWCYHERRDQFRPPATQKKRRMLMELDHTSDEFLGLIDLSINRYFNQPEYWRKDGKLFFSIFNVKYFVEMLGEDVARNAILEARRRVAEAGLGMLHVNAQGVGKDGQQMAQRIGFDSVTDYNIPPDATQSGLTSFESMARRSREVWAANANGPLPYIPVVSTGWDRSARCELSERLPWRSTEYPYGSIVTNATSLNFEGLLRDAKAYAEADPKRCGAVYVNAWNEYTECPGLLPSVRELDFRLRALARVFGRKPKDRFVTCEMKKFWKKGAENGRAIEIEMPTLENVKYGSHERQGMDVWLPGRLNGKLVPCVIYIHGGAWMDGNRINSDVIDWLKICRKENLALVSITYRMIPDAQDAGVCPLVKAPVDDAIAAAKYVLSCADEWGIDTAAMGLTGGSAGACASLIAAFRDNNPLKIKALYVSSPQTSLDPVEMREWVPNIRYGAHAFGFKDFEEWLGSRDEVMPLIEMYSPAALARKIAPDDAPVVFYSCGKLPGAGELAKDPTHAPQFCVRFEEICRSRGVFCTCGKKNDFVRTLKERKRR